MNQCGIIFYTHCIQKDVASLYYYKLPAPDFGTGNELNNPVYSKKYGLIILKNIGGNIGFLDLTDNGYNDTQFELKWKVKELPDDLNMKWLIPPSYQLIDQNETKLFLINSRVKGRTYADKRAWIYNLDNNECEILADNPFPVQYGSIYFNINNKPDTILLGGGHGKDSMKIVHSYNLYKNEYIDDLPRTKHPYKTLPKLWQDKNGVIHICTTYHLKSPNQIFYEWIDPRQDNKKWTINNNVNSLIQKVFPKERNHEIDHRLSYINFH